MPDASTPRVARVWYAKYGRLVVLASWLSRVGLVVVLVCAAGGVLAGCRDDSRSQQSRGEERRSEVSRKSRGKADAMTV